MTATEKLDILLTQEMDPVYEFMKQPNWWLSFLEFPVGILKGGVAAVKAAPELQALRPVARTTADQMTTMPGFDTAIDRLDDIHTLFLKYGDTAGADKALLQLAGKGVPAGIKAAWSAASPTAKLFIIMGLLTAHAAGVQQASEVSETQAFADWDVADKYLKGLYTKEEALSKLQGNTIPSLLSKALVYSGAANPIAWFTFFPAALGKQSIAESRSETAREDIETLTQPAPFPSEGELMADVQARAREKNRIYQTGETEPTSPDEAARVAAGGTPIEKPYGDAYKEAYRDWLVSKGRMSGTDPLSGMLWNDWEAKRDFENDPYSRDAIQKKQDEQRKIMTEGLAREPIKPTGTEVSTAQGGMTMLPPEAIKAQEQKKKIDEMLRIKRGF